VILVEGLFDYAVLWQAGFHNVTCSMGSHLNGQQYRQLCDSPRTVCLALMPIRTAAANRRAVTCRQAQRARRERSQSLLARSHDPNSFFVENGDARQFRSLLEAALP